MLNKIKIRLFITIAVVALALATWLFRKPKLEIPSPTLATPDISAEVTGIRAVQTNEQTGQTEYELTAERLTQNEKTGKETLINAKLLWFLNNGTIVERYEITAPMAYLDKDTGDFVFEQGFLLQKSTNNTLLTQLSGKHLTGNLKQKRLASQYAIIATFIQPTGENRFEAGGFVGDLSTGVYEFLQTQTILTPPTRQDRPLF